MSEVIELKPVTSTRTSTSAEPTSRSRSPRSSTSSRSRSTRTSTSSRSRSTRTSTSSRWPSTRARRFKLAPLPETDGPPAVPPPHRVHDVRRRVHGCQLRRRVEAADRQPAPAAGRRALRTQRAPPTAVDGRSPAIEGSGCGSSTPTSKRSRRAARRRRISAPLCSSEGARPPRVRSGSRTTRAATSRSTGATLTVQVCRRRPAPARSRCRRMRRSRTSRSSDCRSASGWSRSPPPGEYVAHVDLATSIGTQTIPATLGRPRQRAGRGPPGAARVHRVSCPAPRSRPRSSFATSAMSPSRSTSVPDEPLFDVVAGQRLLGVGAGGIVQVQPATSLAPPRPRSDVHAGRNTDDRARRVGEDRDRHRGSGRLGHRPARSCPASDRQ